MSSFGRRLEGWARDHGMDGAGVEQIVGSINRWKLAWDVRHIRKWRGGAWFDWHMVDSWMQSWIDSAAQTYDQVFDLPGGHRVVVNLEWGERHPFDFRGTLQFLPLFRPVTKMTKQIIPASAISATVREVGRFAREERPGACNWNYPRT